MNNLTDKLLTKVVDPARTLSVIANVADKILSYVLPEDNAAAWCFTINCYRCIDSKGYQNCRKCCWEDNDWKCSDYRRSC